MENEFNHWIDAHHRIIGLCTFLVMIVMPALLTGLREYEKTRSVVSSLIAFLSVVTPKNSPGTFKAPLSEPEPPIGTPLNVNSDKPSEDKPPRSKLLRVVYLICFGAAPLMLFASCALVTPAITAVTDCTAITARADYERLTAAADAALHLDFDAAQARLRELESSGKEFLACIVLRLREGYLSDLRTASARKADHSNALANATFYLEASHGKNQGR